VNFWDKKPTASGVPRGQQRALYDERRREVLPQHGITLIEFSHSDFKCDSRKRLLRLTEDDERVVREKLSRWLQSR
jgi:hypothetical protein